MTQAGNASAMGAGSQGASAQGAGSQQGGAQGVVDQAKDTVQQVAGQAKEQATQRAQGVFDQGKARAADQLTGVAQTLRQTTQQLQSGGQLAFAAPYLDRGVGQLERLAEYVRTADVQDVAQQAEGFARRQPALFLGILFGAGLAGARFVKSSQRAAMQQGGSRGYPNYGGSGGGSASYGGTSGAGYGESAAGGYGSSYGSGAGSSYGGGTTGMGTGSMGVGSSAGGSYTGSQGGSATGDLSGSVGGFYDDSDVTRTSRTSGGVGSTGASSDASDERGMDIGPTSSGLRGDI